MKKKTYEFIKKKRKKKKFKDIKKKTIKIFLKM